MENRPKKPLGDPPPRRRLAATLASGVIIFSMLLCVAAWLTRAGWMPFQLDWEPEHSFFALTSSKNDLMLDLSSNDRDIVVELYDGGLSFEWELEPLPAHPKNIALDLKVLWYRQEQDYGYEGGAFRTVLIGVAPEFLALLVITYPVIFLWCRRRAMLRYRRGWCVSCGYDLSGSVSSVCAECGRRIGPSHENP